jgi:Flp pilus assembly protein, ATPase CpaF
MADFNPVVPTTTNPMITGESKKRGGMDFRVYQELKTGIHRDLLNKVDLEKVATVRDDRIRRQVFAVIQELVSNLKTPMSGPERERLALEVLDEVFGLGPLEPLLQDPTITDILVNGAKEVFVERSGQLEETKIMFKDDAHLMHIIDKIVSAIGDA